MTNILYFINKVVLKRGNLLFFFFLVACFLSRLNSQFFLIDIIGQLGFQIIICGILLFIILIILKRLLASLICILICVSLTIDILSSCNLCNFFLKDKSQNHNKIRLMTFNTGFGNDFKNIRELILFEKPEIIQFQEVSSQMQDKLKSLKLLFPYNTGLDKPLEQFSSIVLSKYPLKNTKVVDNYTVLTKVILGETELTIIGIHLSPPLNRLLLNLYVDLYFKYSNTTKPQSLPLVGLNIAIKQMEYLKTLVDNTNQNLILMGDLNMTTTSKRFTNFLKDTNLYTYASYKHPTFTWPAFVPGYLGIQIDHVLFSENFKMIRKKTTNHFGSDHRGLIVDLAF